MRKLLLAAALVCGAMSASADYSDYFEVETADGKIVENGSTVICTDPELLDAGFVNEHYEYSKVLYFRNVTDELCFFNGIYTFGTNPTRQQYNTERNWGFAKMCSLHNMCYGDNLPDNLGLAEMKMDAYQSDGLNFQLTNLKDKDLISEYVIQYYNIDFPEDLFECKIVFAPTLKAAYAYLGIHEEILDETLIFSPALTSSVTELSTIEIYNESLPVALNEEMAGTPLLIYTNTGEFYGEIPYENVTIAPKGALTKAVITLPQPITEEGDYRISIPDDFFMFGTEEWGFHSKNIGLAYTVVGKQYETAIQVLPAPGTIEELSTISLLRPNLTQSWAQDSHYRAIQATLTLPDGSVVDMPAGGFDWILEDPDDFWSDIIGLSYNLGTTYTEDGKYVLNIPAGMFYLNEGSNPNKELQVVWTIGTVGVDSVLDTENVNTIYTINGVQLKDRCLDNLPAGFYIVNGKKMIIR